MPSLRDTDPRHLAALVAVADHGTFARAAQALGFTQSAVSQQIAQLERAAGVALFDRPKGPRPAEFTSTGQIVLEWARRSLARVDQMDAQLDLLRRGRSGQLIVGTFQSASAELLPNILGAMRDHVPDVDVQLDETDDLDALMREVLQDEIDLAFTIDADDDPRIEIDLLGYDPFVVLAPAERPARQFVTVADLNTRPLIGQPGDETGQRLIDQRLTGAGISPDYAYRFRNNAAVQSMVRSGMGWAVMPSLAVDHDDPDIAVLRLDPPLHPRAIQLIRRSGRTLLPAAADFRSIAKKVGRGLLEARA
ncbi:LysR family transcriptional regulator [Ilumatobacter nonamiensis]|uniref:LysR family transcriptional regulator n=1 Tax=Ilumatobacter nonamiensis TaxID=467093 RepID=UPI00058B7CB9|nr:LysR family transcriptional regulator [Ilumatobacter nonamiensis]